MFSRLRSIWISINGSYWFYPTLLSLAAAALAVITIQLDRRGAGEWLAGLEMLTPAAPDGARNLLNVIAASMIAIASTVFAITIAAVVYASGSYGPRLLTNFMEDRGNQLSLGVFIATFIYASMALRVVRGADEQAMLVEGGAASGFVPQLSLLVATAMAAIAIAVLVYFLNHIPSSIRINTVLEGIGKRLLHDIKERFPEGRSRIAINDFVHGAPVRASRSGYVRLIDFEGLERIARDLDARFALAIHAGDFVHPAIPLVTVADCAVDEASADRIAGCFSLGGERAPSQDLEFLIDELVEIALRALSPGINDPFTAITAMHWLGAATAEIARRDLRPISKGGRGGKRPRADSRRRFRAFPGARVRLGSRIGGGQRAGLDAVSRLPGRGGGGAGAGTPPGADQGGGRPASRAGPSRIGRTLARRSRSAARAVRARAGAASGLRDRGDQRAIIEICRP